VLTVLLMAACGGSGSDGLSGGGDGAVSGDGPADGSANGGDANASDGSPSARDASDGGSTTLDASDASDSTSSTQDGGDANDGAPSTQDASDASSDAPVAPCPDVRGAYSITAVDATGCGSSLNTGASQCIRQGQQTTCGITLQSMPSGGGNRAINGDATLQSDGSFSGAALMEGPLNRTGCTGTWDAANSTMTVDCGGTGSSQACVLALRRTGSMCN
jgi:hypothetical protein